MPLLVNGKSGISTVFFVFCRIFLGFQRFSTTFAAICAGLGDAGGSNSRSLRSAVALRATAPVGMTIVVKRFAPAGTTMVVMRSAPTGTTTACKTLRSGRDDDRCKTLRSGRDDET
jgi:hypothetical protein